MDAQTTNFPNWQDAFASYTTSVAFSIQLSKVQVLALDAIDTEQWNKGSFHMFYATANALIRRGLAEYSGNRACGWLYRLTPAGKLVLDLVRMSGAAAPGVTQRAA